MDKEFGVKIAKLEQILMPFAVRLTKDIEDAKDLIQDTMAKALRNKDKFADGTNLKAWLYVIMRNTFITQYHRKIRRNIFVDTTDNQYHLTSGESVDNGGQHSLAVEEIHNAMRRIPHTLRTPLMMYANGYKYYEIADILNVPIGTVKNRIHTARKHLKSDLARA